MIDTIVLTLSHGTYTITNPDAFTPSARWMTLDGAWSNGIRSKQYANKKGSYITLMRLNVPARTAQHAPF